MQFPGQLAHVRVTNSSYTREKTAARGLRESCRLNSEVAALGHKAALGPQSHTPEDHALPPPVIGKEKAGVW